jgi:hypothetical protein
MENFIPGDVRLTPWTDPIVFARSSLGELSVPRDEFSALWLSPGEDVAAQIAACTARFGDWADLLEDRAGL